MADKSNKNNLDFLLNCLYTQLKIDF